MTNQEIVDELIKDFVETEERLGWASSTRKRNLTTEKQKQLDTLARLLTNKITIARRRPDTCIAIFLKKNGQLLVASNLEEPRYASGYLKDLKDYIETSEESHDETYRELVKRAVQQIFSFIVANKQRRVKGNLDLKKLSDFKSLVERKKDSLDTQSLENIQEKAKEAFQEFQEKRIEGWQWDYLLPLIDTNMICNEVRDGVFNQKLIESITNEKIFYVKDKLNMHAEMKILNKLYEKRTKSFPEVGYIGITKLCCSPCQTMIELVNSKMFEAFNYCGDHGSTYNGWIIPNFYQEELIESLKREKKWESSSDIPQRFSRDLYGKFERNWVEIHQEFENQELKDSWSKCLSWEEAKGWFESKELSPKDDLEFVLWMRDQESKNNSISKDRNRLVKSRTTYQKYQQDQITQQFENKIVISRN